ncbi:hypothetical protein KKB44_04885 [Candidatus Micrarchaeota archaeon]|nr:hypothetical protein [Candidatus Micrarchaeota archaeon]
MGGAFLEPEEEQQIQPEVQTPQVTVERDVTTSIESRRDIAVQQAANNQEILRLMPNSSEEERNEIVVAALEGSWTEFNNHIANAEIAREQYTDIQRQVADIYLNEWYSIFGEAHAEARTTGDDVLANALVHETGRVRDLFAALYDAEDQDRYRDKQSTMFLTAGREALQHAYEEGRITEAQLTTSSEDMLAAAVVPADLGGGGVSASVAFRLAREWGLETGGQQETTDTKDETAGRGGNQPLQPYIRELMAQQLQELRGLLERRSNDEEYRRRADEIELRLARLVGGRHAREAREEMERQGGETSDLIEQILERQIELSRRLHTGELAGVVPDTEERMV